MAHSDDDDAAARFERLFHDHHATVAAYVRRRSDASTADDVVAETFIVAWRRIDDVPAEPRPWLLGVARRVLSTQRRGERRRLALVDRLGAAVPAPVAPDLDMPDRGLRTALEALPDRDREALLLIGWEGLSPVEAAAVMGVSGVTMRVRLHRARRRLAHALEERGAARLHSSPAAEGEE